jgi:membrane protease subunit HflC
MKKAAIIIVAVIVALILISQSLYTVDMTKQVVILQLGRYIKTVDEPGLHIKTPFIQSVTSYEKRILVSDAAPGEYLDFDKKRLEVDHITRWRINDPIQFYKTVRNEPGALARLQPIVFSELRDELALHKIAEIISVEREQIMDTVAGRVRGKVAGFGIDIVDVRIKRADLPGEVRDSVFARMEAERQRKAKKYRAEGAEVALQTRADADKKKTVILAEAYEQSQKLMGKGDAEATKICADAFGQDPEFYSFLRTLEAYEKFLPGGTTLVLGADSELFKYLRSAEPVK